MFIAIALSFFLIVAVIGWHFWCIQGLYKIMPDNKDHSHFLRSVAVLLLLFAVAACVMSSFSLCYVEF